MDNAINDWDLVALVRSGEWEAFDEIIRRYRPLIKKIDLMFYQPEIEMDDWVQEARIVLWKTIERFQVKRKDAFGTYFKTCLMNRRRDLARRHHAKKRQIVAGRLEIDANPELASNLLIDKYFVRPEEVVRIREQIQFCLEHVFSKFEGLVFKGLSCNRLEEEIAAEFAVPVAKVQNARERIKHKLRGKLDPEKDD